LRNHDWQRSIVIIVTIIARVIIVIIILFSGISPNEIKSKLIFNFANFPLTSPVNWAILGKMDSKVFNAFVPFKLVVETVLLQAK